jgi:hypothetical protein
MKRWTTDGDGRVRPGHDDGKKALPRDRLTRRSMLVAGLGLATASASSPGRADDQPPNPNKIPQADAQYQPTPKGMFSCAVCTFFIKPRSCKVVAGDISPSGWCKLFDLPD